MVDEARVLEFNKKVKGYKEQFQRLSMQKDVKEENLKRSLEEASKALGVEVTEDNVEQILKEYTEKVNSQMENGEAIFNRINGQNEQNVQNETVQQTPVQQTPVQQAPVQQAPMNQFQQAQMNQFQQNQMNQMNQMNQSTPVQETPVQNNEQQDSVFSQWNMGNAMNPFNNGAANNNPFGGNQMFGSLNNGIPSGQNII